MMSSSLVIAFITVFLSFSGVICGFRFGKIKGLKVELLGGLILIAIGIKILIEHTLLGKYFLTLFVASSQAVRS